MTDKKIPGIHNYCDRWCERCYFTSRCAVYEDGRSSSPQEQEAGHKVFRDTLAENFAKAKHLLEQAAARHGVDLQELVNDIEEKEKSRESIKRKSRLHPLAVLSQEYSDIAGEWLASQPGMMEVLEGMRDDLSLGSVDFAKTKEQTDRIKDCLAVIQWYEGFIHVKFMRALMGKTDMEGDESAPSDFNGSAKIALIGLERSMQAWAYLFELIPDGEDDFLKILAMLDRMKRMATKEFPQAEKFIRPGFDEGC
jgi:hypothetical protein